MRKMNPARTLFAGALLVLASTSSVISGEGPRNVDTDHLFTPPAERQAWEDRARFLRQQILFSTGLSPMPERTPLNPRVTGKIETPDYTVENVAIETLPGFFLCGNLYRPKGKTGPFPGIIVAHGHWDNGRLHVEADVPEAAPPPAPPGKRRADLVAIGANLARQGHVVFAYDMVGYNDTNQVPKHREFAKDLRCWSWGVSLFGLQTWNSIRALDYVESLPDVDKTRLGMTGASGGGTQTFILAAIDERIKVAVPVNMISSHMQGGCLCENAPGLRVGTDNVEIGALMAPRPLLLVAATGDWTKDVPRLEWPVIRKIYQLYGAAENTAVAQFNYEHNYNKPSREAMYAWFGRWFLKDTEVSHFREQPHQLDPKAMRIWTEKDPMPATALTQTQLIDELIRRAQQRVAAIDPADDASLQKFKQLMRPALQYSLNVHAPGEIKDLPASGPEGGKPLLIVSTGDTAELQQAASTNYRTFTLKLDPITESLEKLAFSTNYKVAFDSTYNRTPLGDRVQRIVDAIAFIKQSTKQAQVAIIADGQAGLWTLFARAIEPGNGACLIDSAQLDASNEDVFLASLYAPGLRNFGAIRSAVLLGTPGPLAIHNTADKHLFSALKINQPTIIFRVSRLNDQQKLDWIKSQTPK